MALGWFVVFSYQFGIQAADWAIPPELQDYFEHQVESIEHRSKQILYPESKESWGRKAPELRRQLAEMLGLDPMPKRTPLSPVVTKTVHHELYTVQNLHFQSLPGLYVTGNLYLPKDTSTPQPAILYVCGHASAKKGNISFGNKTAYQHHGIWFAKHGFVCLTIDTIQLGEIEGTHHGTYRYGRWWWNSKGYTPAGVEAWNGMRALDYLQSRQEVDPDRLGITGRSGGGVYSWWVAALDERVKVAVPVAGITDLRNYVVDGAVEGHCDCMFMVNQYRWDYPLIASLIAPRPLLVANSDKDSIFPLDGVIRTHEQVRNVYNILDASDRLGLLITEGPHKDTQDLQVPTFRWFQRWLKGIDEPVTVAALKEIPPDQLRVFDQLPADEIVTSVDSSFIKVEPNGAIPKSMDEWEDQISRRIEALKAHSFAESGDDAVDEIAPGLFPFWQYHRNAQNASIVEITERPGVLKDLSPHKINQIRRRYMLIGQTLDSTRVLELSRTLQRLISEHNHKDSPLIIKAEANMAVNAIYAGLLLDPGIWKTTKVKFHLSHLPASHMEGPDYLNIMKVTRLGESLASLARHVEVVVEQSPQSLNEFNLTLVSTLGREASKLKMVAEVQ